MQQLYRINKCLYGLPDSGRHFYRHYRDTLIAEGYIMSEMDNCLFCCVPDVETTLVVLFVDNTLIFSNRHYELKLDAKKTHSFLAINIEHRDDRTLITQPKLLQKLFKEHPKKIGKRKARMPLHPYGPAPAHNTTTIKEQSLLIPVTTYLRLLGLLMYLIKSRPDFMTAVSFGATKSTSPTYKG